VDIRSETEFAEEEAEMGYQEEEVSGRCAAILANGKRCPNASLPGSRYCGLPAHQALEGTGTDYLVPPEDEGGEEPSGDGSEEPAEVAAADDGVAEAGAAEDVAAAEEGALEASSSENGDLPVEDLVEPAPVEEAPVEEAPVANADEVVDDGVAELEAAQENEAIDAGEAPPADEAAAEGTDES
jgi:N utilization substance protein A